MVHVDRLGMTYMLPHPHYRPLIVYYRMAFLSEWQVAPIYMPLPPHYRVSGSAPTAQLGFERSKPHACAVNELQG